MENEMIVIQKKSPGQLVIFFVLLAACILFLAPNPQKNTQREVILETQVPNFGSYDEEGHHILFYIEGGNIYDGYQINFKEPFEILYFLFDYGYVIRVTNQDPIRVTGYSPEQIILIAKRFGLTIKNLHTIIHSHLYPSNFSKNDIDRYNEFVEVGFEGKFLIFFTFSKRIIEHVGN